MQNKTSSVAKTIASSLLLILLLSVVTTGVAIFTLSSSLKDAEAVNVAGSMRMQSYRLAYDIKSDLPDFSHHVDLFETSILSPSMQALSAWYVPEDITQDYYALIKRWQTLKTILRSEEKSQYLDLVSGFVEQIDRFVFKLQRFSEQKLITLAWIGGIGLGGILLISVFVVRFTRKEIVRPLHALVSASEQIQSRSFDVQLSVGTKNELGILTRTFNHMAQDLGKLYRGLEKAVNEKTRRLQVANQSLEVLYRSSQELTASVITADNFQAILKQLVSVEGVEAARLEIDNPDEKPMVLFVGEGSSEDGFELHCHVNPLMLDNQPLGTLYWKAGLPCADLGLIDNFVQILSRAIYYNHAQQQASQLLLMEERATIARELHDSLAQSLSYLKIQMSLLKRQITAIEPSVHVVKTQQVISELDAGLSSAYTQLRELLTTFRLTIKEGSFGSALSEMLKQLEEQSSVRISLKNDLSSVELDAHQQVHLLQLMREATINAIKHAKASHIDVACYEQQGEVIIRVKDDGVGFENLQTKRDHYGMSIMQERASRLNGELKVSSSPNQGCEIVLTYPRGKE